MDEKKLFGVAITLHLLVLACLVKPAAAQPGATTTSCGAMGITRTV